MYIRMIVLASCGIALMLCSFEHGKIGEVVAEAALVAPIVAMLVYLASSAINMSRNSRPPQV